MDIFTVVMLIATLLCALVAGFLLAFAIVVMPGIKTFSDYDFLKSFKVMDKVIQDNSPSFMIVWAGSVFTLLIAAVMAFFQLDGINLILVVSAAVLYMFGVQLPTGVVNVPLNNALQKKDLDNESEKDLSQSRIDFEARWVKWNSVRTVVSILTALILIIVMFRL